jgi:biotin operon repressor
MQKGHANDLILATLAVYGPLVLEQLAETLGVPRRTLWKNVAGLQRKGLLTRVRVEGRASQRAVALDARRAGAEHLAAYLTEIAAVGGAPTLIGVAPSLTDDIAPFPQKPSSLFGHPARDNVLLALSLSSELKASELAAICGRNRTAAFKVVIRALRLRGLVRPAQRRGRNESTALDSSLPGAGHLRRFLKATAVAYHPRLVLSARVILRDAFSAD